MGAYTAPNNEHATMATTAEGTGSDSTTTTSPLPTPRAASVFARAKERSASSAYDTLSPAHETAMCVGRDIPAARR
ncbi:hypothetical protein GCM10010211_82550 [Streptomyces albospinus]|uniref:Uncharacterized protein n=1 Tax=Streptomyces albospinus TaxID=285515 RepID=A0ABQ2VNM4_9ACTN|nr:hypothetical protein GCM10010211_82550 [Streptomyces albospinus]